MFLMIFNATASLAFSISKSETTETVNQIKRDYSKTNEELKNYEARLVKIEPAHGTSYYSAGDSAEYYTENGKLKKITVFQFFMLGENDTEKWINCSLSIIYFLAFSCRFCSSNSSLVSIDTGLS